MKTSPLQLDESYILEVIVKANEDVVSADFKPSDIRINAEPTYLQSEADPLKWEVDLSVLFFGSNEKPVPYSGRVICKGFFTISHTLDEKTQKRIVAVNGPAMLFSAAREIVANLTGRGRFGKMLRPSITFLDERKRFEPALKELETKDAPKLEAKAAAD